MGKYQVKISHEKALRRRTGKKGNRLKNTLIRTYAKEKLKLGWSLLSKLPCDFPEIIPERAFPYEVVYQYIYSQIHRQGNGLVKKGSAKISVFSSPEDTRGGKRKAFGKRKGFSRKAIFPLLRIVRNMQRNARKSDTGKMTVLFLEKAMRVLKALMNARLESYSL